MKKRLPEIFFLLLISAIAYLPQIGNLTYYKDDWYYIYDGILGGAKIFHEMFRIDRPARGFFFEWYYAVFGPNPLPWHLGVFVWRALTAIGALWIFSLLWKENRKFNFIAALLFVLYPGYFWWISAIEYQPMIASLALQVFSIAFTLKSIQTNRKVEKVTYLLGAILTGWGYIALVDYAIGMEVFRFLAVFVLVTQNSVEVFWKKIIASFRALSWSLLAPAGFTLWRVLIFDNQRQATDIGAQFGEFLGNPVATGLSWLLQAYNSLLNLAILAWIGQFPRYLLGMRLRDLVMAVVLAISAGVLTALASKLFRGEHAQGDEATAATKDALMLGGIGMVLGIAPVIMANRYINLDIFSHYALPASLASAVFLTGLIYSWSSRSMQNIMFITVVVFAVLAHFGIAANAVNEERAIEKFWWQVNWRVPALKPGTLLVINYPAGNIGDDGNGVVEAPNVMYFSQPSNEVPVRYPVAALTFSDSILQDVMAGSANGEWVYRSHVISYDYANTLVLSQPTPTSCVHVLDSRHLLLSENDPGSLALAASASDIENVLADAEPITPPGFAFGSEPERGWCYYFEKAELALQRGAWEETVSLGNQAIDLSYAPEDRVEWLPFLYANAIAGNADWLEQIAKRVIGNKAVRLQACEMLNSINQPLNADVREVIDTSYCKGSG